MLSFFRSFIKSRVGLIIVFVFLGVIALAFGLTGNLNLPTQIGNGGGELVKVGDRTITELDVRTQIDVVKRNMSQRGQAFSMQQFLSEGGYESVLKDMITADATVEFARQNGMTVSNRLVDSEINSAPIFKGPDGSFNQKAFDNFLAEQRYTIDYLRGRISESLYLDWLHKPLEQVNQVPAELAATYAGLDLVRHTGLIATIPAVPNAIADPDEKTLAAFYSADKGRFMVPQRRVIRYALVSAADVRARSAATDAEIAAAYNQAGTRFAAKEKRSAHQLILIDQATANRVAGEIKGGKSIADEAKAMGLEAANFDGREKADFVKQASPQIADAVFAAPQGGVIGPIRTPLGWAVLQVDKIEKVAAKSLDQARPELAAEITTRKTFAALKALYQTVQDAIGNGATFDEAVAKAKLTATRVGPLAADGTDPDNPAAKPDPTLIPILRAGFAVQPGDDPQVPVTDKDSSFAVVAPERVVPAAARPLDQVRKELLQSYKVNRAMRAAEDKASAIVAQIKKGVPIEKAFAAANVVPAKGFQKFDYVTGELGKNGKQPPAEIIRSIGIPPGNAAGFAIPDGSGFEIINTTAIEQHDAHGNTQLMNAVAQTLRPLLGNEQLDQFDDAIRRAVKTVRNEAAIARLKADLAGHGTAQ